MRNAARAAETAEEEVSLEKPKNLAGKEAALRAAMGQAGKDKRAAEEAKRRAATGQADKDKYAAGEAARKAATRQAGKVKRAAEEATRWAKKNSAAATALEEAAAKSFSFYLCLPNNLRFVALVRVRSSRSTSRSSTWAPRSSTCEKQRAAPRASA
jgi:hypothetical protein